MEGFRLHATFTDQERVVWQDIQRSLKGVPEIYGEGGRLQSRLKLLANRHVILYRWTTPLGKGDRDVLCRYGSLIHTRTDGWEM